MIITRYLTREVVAALLAIITILLLAFVSQQLVRYLNYVAIGKIPTNVLLQLVGFEVPYLFALLLPLALYLGILLAFGRLYADSEMAILHLYGFGKKYILRLVMTIAVAVAGVILVLMLWVNPRISAERQKIMQSDAATLHLIQTVMPGRFQVTPDGSHVMYVEKLSRDHQRAENIFIAKKTKNSADSQQADWMLVLANQGYQTTEKKTEDLFFVTLDGYRYEGVPGQSDYKIIQFKKYAVRMLQNNLSLVHQQDEGLLSEQLWRDYANPKRAAELQWRLSIGLSALLLAFLAIPLSAVRPRHGRYVMFLPAILVYIVYINLLFIARHWVAQGVVPTMIGMWWVHGIMLLMGLVVSSW